MYKDYSAASKAIDGKLNTSSHTMCAWNTDIWFRMQFNDVYCFTEVRIIGSKLNSYALRMQDTMVYVLNNEKGTEQLCGVLEVMEVFTIEGQTYR